MNRVKQDPNAELRAASPQIGERFNGRVHLRGWTPHHVITYDRIMIPIGWEPDSTMPRNGFSLDLRPELHIDGDVIVPDMAGWKADRRVEPTGDEPYGIWSRRCYTSIPDWVCDIAEPSSVGFLRKTKLPVYQRLGVSWIWVVDRIERRLEVAEGAYEGDGVVYAAPFERVAISLGALFERV